MLCYNIVTNYICNLECRFCSQYPKDISYYPSKQEIMKEIFFARKSGFERIGFDGGEVTLRDDLIEIIRFSKRLNFLFVRIQTNGLLLSDKYYSIALSKAGLDFCKFTFLSHDSKLHNYLVRNEKAFELSLNGLENLISLQVRVGVNILLNKLNYEKMIDTIKFFLKFGVENFVIIFPTYYGKMLDNVEELKISYHEVQPVIAELLSFISKNRLRKIKFLNFPPCILDNDFKKSFEYNKFKTILVEIGRRKWNIDEEQDRTKVKVKQFCDGCSFINKCKGINRDYLSVFGKVGKRTFKKVSKYKTEEFFLTQDDNCIIRLLRRHPEGVITEKILENAKNIPICKDCVDANSLLNALLRLQKKGIIKSVLVNGTYRWKLAL